MSVFCKCIVTMHNYNCDARICPPPLAFSFRVITRDMYIYIRECHCAKHTQFFSFPSFVSPFHLAFKERGRLRYRGYRYETTNERLFD